jgi:signal transduction histidine kinase
MVKAGMLEIDGAGAKLCRLTALDISLRKQAEQALESERELFAIFQSAPIIMILLDENLRVLKANRAALQAVRRDMDESQGLRLGEMLRCMNATAENGGCGASPGCLSCFIRDMQLHPQMSRRECHQVEIKLLLNIGSGTVEFFALFSTKLLNIEGRRLVLVCIEDVTERKKAADELQAYQSRLEDLASQLFVAQEGERRRIAADLHDGVVQRMGLCSQKLKLLRSGKVEGNEHLDEIIRSLDQAIADSRSLIGELSPPVLHILGLGPALEWLAQGFNERRGLEVKLNLTDLPPGVEREVRIFLYRSCAELLTNVIKHSQCRKSRVSLSLDENELTLSVEDAGRGFVHSMEAYGGGQGFGLFNISEMLRKWNGRLKVERAALGGAKVSMVLPVYACWPRKQSGDQ